MTHPEFWGWSTGPLTIHFWGWENASSLKERFGCAPRLVHDVRLPWVALDETRSCIVASASTPPKSVRGSYPGITVSEAHVQGVCCEESAYLVSCCSSTPKTQNIVRVEKVVEQDTRIPSPVSAWSAAKCESDQRRIPKISI